MNTIRTINEAVEKLYGLNVGVIGQGSERHERPHKPVLLLAVLDLIASGRVAPDRVVWSPELRNTFTRYFDVVRNHNDQDTPENPFYRLSSDGFWEAFEGAGGIERPLGTTPTATQAINGTVFARIAGGMEQFVRFPEQRSRLRDALISRYFPAMRLKLAPLFVESGKADATPEEQNRCKEADDDSPGRDPAFRRIVLEVYDFQCAACGLRIKLPDADLTFVDGAHIMPFSKSRNDHPTNGLALCKNHHWAMDRFLIVPTPEGVWKASSRLVARRSPGEEALVALHDQPILPPHEDAFRPDVVSLAWRAERLYA